MQKFLKYNLREGGRRRKTKLQVEPEEARKEE